MEREKKLQILKQLSQTRDDKAVAALVKELAKASKRLSTETDYYVLESIFEEIAVYAFRVHVETFETISVFLRRTEKSDFVNKNGDFPLPSGFQAQQKLVEEALEIIERIRYFNLTAALDVFCAYSIHGEEIPRKKALEGLKKCAAFDIDIYYSGEGRAGFGETPQLEVLKYLERNRAQFTENKVEAATILARGLLSSTMEGTSWNYQTVTWSSGAVPVSDQLSDIRSRTLRFLMTLYRSDQPEKAKRSLISAIWAATETPRTGEVSPKWRSLIEANTISVFNWVKTIVPNETLLIRQKLEHNVYWRFYHGLTDAIRQSALDIRDTLLKDEEYLIFRNLIGFESIFEDWEVSLKKERDFAKIDEERKVKAQEYVDEISTKNWPQWRDRILRFCETRSDDLATFPIFYDFLFNFAKAHPRLALELVGDNISKVEPFEIPLFRGLWNSQLRDEFRPILMNYVSAGKNLIAGSKMFIGIEYFDREILETVLEVASRNVNIYALSQVLVVAASNYKADKSYVVEKLFMPTISKLSEIDNTDWIHSFWYKQEMQELIAELDEANLELILGALEKVEDISFQTEEVLKVVAAKYPKKVIGFFGNRIKRGGVTAGYDAIPFDLHSLKEPLSKHPYVLVDTVRDWAQHDDSMFRFHGGRLVSVVFPNFSDELKSALLPLAKSGNKSDAKFVIGILRNYHGETFLHDICRELVISNSEDKSLISDVIIVLYSTGVVTGEYGLAEAYARKAQEIKYWLSDENRSVREFANSYIEMLMLDEARERKDADESIELRKHKFGVKNSDTSP